MPIACPLVKNMPTYVTKMILRALKFNKKCSPQIDQAVLAPANK